MAGTRGRISMLLFAIIAIGFLSGCNQVWWERDYGYGMMRVQQENRRAIIQFYLAMDEGCIEMDRNVFSDPEVQKLMEDFVCIRVDQLLNQELAREYEVEQLPAFYVVRPDRTIAGSFAGTKTAEEFRIFLIKNSFN